MPNNWEDNDCSIRRISRREEVKACALEYLNHHFRQCWDTPGGKEDFKSDFGLLADTMATEQVLDGTY